MTLDDLVHEWAAAAAAKTIESRRHRAFDPGTIESYRNVYRQLIKARLGRISLAQIDEDRLTAFFAELRTAGVADGRIRNATAILRTLLHFAFVRRWIGRFPEAGLPTRRVQPRRYNIASPEVIPAFLDQLSGQDRLLGAAALYTGARTSELRALRWENINWRRSEIHVATQWDQSLHKTKPPKYDGGGGRLVPLLPQLVDELNLFQPIAARRRGPIFVSGRGTPFHPQSTLRRLGKAWTAVGVTQALTFRDCRHTYASIAIAAGCDYVVLAEFMGHASPDTTLRTYAHMFPRGYEEAATKITSYLEDQHGHS